MKGENKKNVFKNIAIVLLVICLAGSNFIWFKVYRRTDEKLKYAVVPSLTNDYFTNQTALTRYAKEQENDGILSDNEFPSFQSGKEYSNEYGNQASFKVDVPHILQKPSYPNGCEAASAVMFLNYYGINISLEDFVDKYLPTSKVYEENGVRFGPDPSQYYAGDPSSETRGWGTFDVLIESTMIKVIKDYAKSDSLLISLPYGKQNLNELTQTNLPLVIWTTTNYKVSNEVYEWKSYDNKNTYTYPKNSHTVVVTGYDENNYYINDPLKDENNIAVPRAELEESFDSVGRQAVFAQKF